ncbi:MFS-type transporter SLC18B1 [Hyalella azteca]|uniref:MFS-type transporter SLC18B1 n=1 Tax=Hyalella azteca TaxID=294128 RepID=A0A979FJ46_HYAAZ|nr:MFS-type transporter SLC18B1 [Hyalella azteca]
MDVKDTRDIKDTNDIKNTKDMFLEWFPPGWEFVVEAMLIRAVQACCNAFVITSTFAFIVSEFPDNIAKLFGPLSVINPLFPSVGEQGSRQDTPAREVTLLDVVRIPGMWISFVTFVFSTMSNGFLSITLEAVVLRKFNISHLHVGFLFGLKDGANSIASPMWGLLCDHLGHLRAIILVSSSLAALSFTLLGPLPGLPLQRTHALVVAALVINGFGVGGQQVAGVVHAMKMAGSGGLPNNSATHGFVAGLWSSLSGGGRFVSRATSGYFVHLFGFRYCCLVVVVLHVIVFTVTASFMLCELLGGKRSPTGGGDPPHPLPGSCMKSCDDDAPTITVITTTTPSEAMASKAITVPRPQVVVNFSDCLDFTPIRWRFMKLTCAVKRFMKLTCAVQRFMKLTWAVQRFTELTCAVQRFTKLLFAVQRFMKLLCAD